MGRLDKIDVCVSIVHFVVRHPGAVGQGEAARTCREEKETTDGQTDPDNHNYAL